MNRQAKAIIFIISTVPVAYGKLGVPFYSSWHGYCTFYTFVGQPFPEGVVVHAKDTVLKQSH